MGRRQLARSSTGIGGQTYLGPSIAEGGVAFYRACHADLGGCSTKDSGATAGLLAGSVK